MAIPTITTIDPNWGPAAGRNLIQVSGTGFREPPLPAYGYLGGATQQTVRVLFNSVEALYVYVESSTVLQIVPPPTTQDPDLASFPAVDIEIINLDDSGSPIPGESVSAVAAYTYSREPLRPPTLSIVSPFVRLGEELAFMLRRQTLLDVGFPVSTDYSEDGIVLKDAGAPSLVITGPSMPLDEFGTENNPVYEEQIDGSFLRYRPPIMHAPTYTIAGSTNSQVEMITLMGTVRQFVTRNPYLMFPADVPAGTNIQCPLVLTTEPAITYTPSDANLRTFEASVEVKRFPVLYVPPHMRTWPIEELEAQFQYTDGVLVEPVTIFSP